MTGVRCHPRFEHADDDSNYHAVEAVEQYKHFLQLKLDEREWTSLSLSPSDELDLVWHLHLLQTGDYQWDCMPSDGHVIEHRSVRQTQTQYERAHEMHCTRMQHLGMEVNIFFWPNPK